MYLRHNIFYMFVFGFIINMIVFPLIMSNSIRDITINMNKFYSSVILSLLIVLSQIYSHDIFNNSRSLMNYIVYIVILLIYIYLYKNQVYIDDNNYLKDLKEKNSSLILISRDRKTKNKRIKSFSDYIVNTLNKENNFIDKIL